MTLPAKTHPSSFRPYPSYKPSGVEWLGEIPEEWDVRRLKFSASAVGGGTPSTSNAEYWKGDIPWVSPKDMKRSLIDSTQDYITELAVAECATSIVKPDTVLVVVRSGILQHSIPVARNLVPVTLNQDMKGITVESSLIPAYLHYLFEGNQKQLLPLWSKQGCTVESIEFEMMMNAAIPHPSLSEQKAIADYLDRKTGQIDELIGKKKELIERLKEQRTALITAAVTGNLQSEIGIQQSAMVDSGVEWLGQVPEHWEVKRIKFLTKILRGKFSHRPRNDPRFYDGEYPFIQTGDVAKANKFIETYTQTLNERGLSVSKQFPAGTLVMTIAANIGDMAVLNFDACFPDSIVGFVPDEISNLDYLYYLFCAMRPEFLKTAILNTQMNLNIERIENLSAARPPKNEQQEIVDYLDQKTGQIDGLIGKAEEAIQRLEEYRTAVITAAVTGKVKVDEASCFVANER